MFRSKHQASYSTLICRSWNTAMCYFLNICVVSMIAELHWTPILPLGCNIPGHIRQYCCCWCPGHLRPHVKDSPGIGHGRWISSCPLDDNISAACTSSVSKSKLNLARIEYSWIFVHWRSTHNFPWKITIMRTHDISTAAPLLVFSWPAIFLWYIFYLPSVDRHMQFIYGGWPHGSLECGNSEMKIKVKSITLAVYFVTYKPTQA